MLTLKVCIRMYNCYTMCGTVGEGGRGTVILEKSFLLGEVSKIDPELLFL